MKGTCNIVDDFTFKLFVSQNHLRKRRLAKADIGNAYLNANRSRGIGWMRLPESLRERYRAEDGSELVLMLLTPIWGEAEAGFEWVHNLTL